MNIAMLLEMSATAMGERPAAGTGEAAATYGRLLSDAASLAGRLRASQAKHLVLCDEPSAVLPVALFGAGWAGVPYVPVNYRLSDDELRALAERAAPALAIASDSNAHRLNAIAGVEVIERGEFMDDPAGGATPASPGDWMTDENDVAALLYTSGTTGAPKSAMLRHRHLVAYVIGTVEFACAGADESHIMSVPPYHIASVAATLSQVYAGRRIVALPRFDADSWIELVRRQNATHAMLVPTMLARIVDEMAHRDETIETLRTLSYGGGKTHVSVVQEALKRFPMTGFVHAYGLTETSSTVSVLGPQDHREAESSSDPAVKSRLASAGRILSGVEVSIRDGDNGERLGERQPGEIWVRGDQVSGEYRENGSMLDDQGWFRTRDQGYFDSDGYLFVLGRNDDMIIRGAENISPGEVEEALLAHPAVTGAAAFAIPSREWGEEVAAAVVLSTHTGLPAPSADELRLTVRSLLRSSRVPSRIEFVDELPYNETGKLLRRELRARFAAPQ